MKAFRNIFIIAASFCLAMLGACGSDTASPQAGELNLTFAPTDSGSTSSALVISEGFDVTRLVLQLRSIKVIPAREDNDADDKPPTEAVETRTGAEVEADDSSHAFTGGERAHCELDDHHGIFKVRGTFLLDVLDASKSTVPLVDLEATVYKKVEFRIDHPDSGEGIDGSDDSLWLEATVQQDGKTFPVRFTTRRVGKITLRNVNGVDLSKDEHENFFVNLQVSSWFDGVKLADLAANAQGVVVIDDNGLNKEAAKTINKNIRAAIKILRKPHTAALTI